MTLLKNGWVWAFWLAANALSVSWQVGAEVILKTLSLGVFVLLLWVLYLGAIQAWREVQGRSEKGIEA